MVLINNTPPQEPRSVTLRNLPPGRYGMCRCVQSGPYEELGVKTVGADGTLAVNLPADSVLTVYPHPGKNLPPTTVDWRAEPSFLKDAGQPRQALGSGAGPGAGSAVVLLVGDEAARRGRGHPR